MSDSDNTPSATDLMKAVLLPGRESLLSFASRIRVEAKDTEWQKSLNRIEGTSVLMTIVGITFMFGYLIYKEEIGFKILEFIGFPTAVATGIAILLIYIKMFVVLIKKINRGESIWIIFEEENSELPKWTKLILATAFMLLSLIMMFSLKISLSQLFVFSVIFFIMIGGFVTSISIFAKMIVLDKYN